MHVALSLFSGVLFFRFPGAFTTSFLGSIVITSLYILHQLYTIDFSPRHIECADIYLRMSCLLIKL